MKRAITLQYLTAAEKEQSHAWTIDQEDGRRTIWVADDSGIAGRQLTKYTEDGTGPKRLSGLNFSADGRRTRLCTLRGEGKNQAGQAPIDEQSAGTEQAVMVRALERGEPKTCRPGTSQRFLSRGHN